jgi:hypothetical protein
MYVIEYTLSDGTVRQSVNMASTEQMAIETFVADHLANRDDDWLDRIESVTATEVKAWARRCPVARRDTADQTHDYQQEIV